MNEQETVNKVIEYLKNDEKYGPWMLILLPHAPLLAKLGQAALDAVIECLQKKDWYGYYAELVKVADHEERMKLLDQSAELAEKAAKEATELQEDAIELLIKVLLGLVPVLLLRGGG